MDKQAIIEKLDKIGWELDETLDKLMDSERGYDTNCAAIDSAIAKIAEVVWRLQQNNG